MTIIPLDSKFGKAYKHCCFLYFKFFYNSEMTYMPLKVEFSIAYVQVH